jgi:hypothetical protein
MELSIGLGTCGPAIQVQTAVFFTLYEVPNHLPSGQMQNNYLPFPLSLSVQLEPGTLYQLH